MPRLQVLVLKNLFRGFDISHKNDLGTLVDTSNSFWRQWSSNRSPKDSDKNLSKQDQKRSSVESNHICDQPRIPLDRGEPITDKGKVDLHTFAELQEDPKASFPPVFTICSTIMTTSSKDTSSLFFTILGKDGNNYLTANLNGDMISLGLGLGSGNIALVPEKRIVRV